MPDIDPSDAPPLEPFPEDWSTALAVVAHPDDMEYGAAAAVARWTSQGKTVVYVIVTDGEAGITTMAPEVVGPARRHEQIDACHQVGVGTVEFLGLPDGLLVEGPELRQAITATIRRHRPEVLLSINHRDSWGGPSWNHVDHRAVGRALLDAARDAANPWIFPDAGEAWDGVRLTAFGGSPLPTHGVDVTDSFEAGVRSLAAHALYLEHLQGDMADPAALLRPMAEAAGASLGTDLATTFEVVT
jgi:LmbE family N-acetylglucosaminyl deacetylase